MSDEMVTIQVDGTSIQAPKGSMLIEATDKAGIKIPRFCYHEKLSVAANCRMCLVEVDKVPKPLPACATPVMDGMIVRTKSPRAIAAQKGTMEFLLINHPLDCPICDQGGECELQDVSLGYGSFESRYVENKRVVREKNIGPLVATDMTRCIHCTRCVRFGEEIAGSRELGATGRGEHTEIGTYIQKNLDSELSGNVIDLCPVGALTSKPFRYTARAWEMSQKDSIAAHDCVGSNVSAHVRRNEVMRIVPRNHDEINECWISDRDRFSYEGLQKDRLLEPKIKVKGEWQTVSWDQALEFTVNHLAIQADKDSAQVGALISPSTTVEEGYLLQKLLRQLGVANIDCRLRQADFSDRQTSWLGQPIANLAKADVTLLIESNVRIDQPMLSHRIRQSVQAGGKVLSVSSVDYPFNFALAANAIVPPYQIVDVLAGIAKAAAQIRGQHLSDGLLALFPASDLPEHATRMAELLCAGKQSTILLGSMATSHPDYGLMRSLAQELARVTGATFGIITHGANTVGLQLAGVQPDATAKSFGEMLGANMQALLIYNFESQYDTYNAQATLAMLDAAAFVVEFAVYENALQQQYADVLLPITPSTETSGTFVNCEGRWQSFAGITVPMGNSRPGWKVLRVLGNLQNLDGFDYFTSSEVLEECRAQVGDKALRPFLQESVWQRNLEAKGSPCRIGTVPPYAVDGVVRRATALQQTSLADTGKARMSAETAAEYGLNGEGGVQLRQGSEALTLPVQIAAGVATGCIELPSYVGQPCTMSSLYGEMVLQEPILAKNDLKMR